MQGRFQNASSLFSIGCLASASRRLVANATCLRQMPLSQAKSLMAARQITLAVSPASSLRMSRVRQKGTAPELTVRAILQRCGIPFKTNSGTLPGSPDLYSSKARFALFIHGCFWHRHAGCKASTTPKTNQSFWLAKFDENLRRDRRNVRQLRTLGYRVITVWGCQVKSSRTLDELERRLIRLLGGRS